VSMPFASLMYSFNVRTNSAAGNLIVTQVTCLEKRKGNLR
jgi:hypothetical protein